MGASASVNHVAFNAEDWLLKYVDSEVFRSDFESIDKDHDGSIAHPEFKKWIQARAQHHPDWRFFSDHEIVCSVAFSNASRYKSVSTTAKREKEEVSVEEFKALLIHLMVTSLLWVHFHTALEVTESKTSSMDFDSFALGVRTFYALNGGEQFDTEKLQEAFAIMDKNQDQRVQFEEICFYFAGLLSKKISLDASDELIHSAIETKGEKHRAVAQVQGMIHQVSQIVQEEEEFAIEVAKELIIADAENARLQSERAKVEAEAEAQAEQDRQMWVGEPALEDVLS